MVGFPKHQQRKIDPRYQGHVVRGRLSQCRRQDGRGIEDARDQPGSAVEQPPSQQSRGKRAEQTEHQPGQPDGHLRRTQQPHRGRLNPEIEDRLVEKRMAQKRRRDPLAPFDHLSGNRRMQPFIGIEQGKGDGQRKNEHDHRQHEGQQHESPVRILRFGRQHSVYDPSHPIVPSTRSRENHTLTYSHP